MTGCRLRNNNEVNPLHLLDEVRNRFSKTPFDSIPDRRDSKLPIDVDGIPDKTGLVRKKVERHDCIVNLSTGLIDIPYRLSVGQFEEM